MGSECGMVDVPIVCFHKHIGKQGLCMIRTFRELDVWRNAVELAMRVF